MYVLDVDQRGPGPAPDDSDNVADTGNLKKLVILKADQNQLLQLPTTIAQYVLIC